MTDERGRMIWISAARPGRAHDITADRRDRILSHLRTAGLAALADLGFLGLDHDPDDPVVVTGFKATRARKLTTDQLLQEGAASLKLAATERHGVHVGFRSSIAGYRKVIFGAVRLRPASDRGRAAAKSRRRDGSAPC
ncbi:hypothetical protein [Streptomyces shenzhenensis]|uniref:hypothetical protein n=1 Tax=Streptomyces shenzhenensis TaxID=943815 RepID=UPI0033D0B5D6